MSECFKLRHYTVYTYEEAVESAHNQMRMLLRDVPGQTCLQRTVRIRPRPDWGKLRTDWFGNRVLWTEMRRPHTVAKIFLQHVIEVQAPRLPEPADTPRLGALQSLLREPLWAQDPSISLFRLPSRLVPDLPVVELWAAEFLRPELPVLQAAMNLMTHIYKSFRFNPQATSISTPIDEVLRRREGVCQDFAHLMIAALRSHGLAARYVSGYIETLPPPGQPRLVGADASHAWLSLWCGSERGWQDLDPTNGHRPRGQHLTTAWGRDYDDVMPLNGVICGGGESSTLRVRVDLERQPKRNDSSA